MMPPMQNSLPTPLLAARQKGLLRGFFLIQATAVILEKRKAMLRLPGSIGQIYKGRA